MMKYTSIVAASLVVASASAQNVACRINGQQGSVVDLDTGVCSFEIPSELPVVFDFTSVDNYTVDAYYVSNGVKFWNDIAEAGRAISVPARDLFNSGNFGFFHVHDSKTPAANSTSSLKRRFRSQVMSKRDEISDLVAHIKSLSGDSVQGFSVEVNEPDVSSNSTSNSTSGVVATSSSTTAAVPIATFSPVASDTTSPVGSDTTSPVGADTTVTHASTTVITITSCSSNRCSETAVSATRGPTTATVNGEVTVYTTWCPISGTEATVSGTRVTIPGTETSVSSTRATVPGNGTTVSSTKATVPGTESSASSTRATVPGTESSASSTRATVPGTESSVSSTKATVPGTESSVSSTKATVPGTESSVSSTKATVPGSGTTVTERETTLITVTSCSNNACTETHVTATRGSVTTNVGGHSTVYTTWVPVSSQSTSTVTERGTTVVTVTSCSDHKCVETEVPATEHTTTFVSEGETITHTTHIPVSSTTAPGAETPGSESTTTSHGGVGSGAPSPSAPEGSAPGSESTTTSHGGVGSGAPSPGAPEGSAPGSESTTTSHGGVGSGAPSPGAPEVSAPGSESTTTSRGGVGSGAPHESHSSTEGEATPSVSSLFNGAGKYGASFVAIIALPLAYLL